MPIRDYPFTDINNIQPRPLLWIRIINAHDSSKTMVTPAVVDTGVDACLFPSSAAPVLGHNLKKGFRAGKATGIGGEVDVFRHSTRLEVLNTLKSGFPGNKVLYSLPDTAINFSDADCPFLLGSGNFLSKFVLTVNYPQRKFSLCHP